MAGFLYFLPGRVALEPGDDALRETETGLAAVFGEASFDVAQVTGAGPDGNSPGIVVALHPAAEDGVKPRCGYFADAQEWRECPRLPAGGYWLAFERGNPPGPADLARREQIAGHLVRLADGHDWLVPAARVFPRGTALPESLILGPDGELVREILPRYAAFGGRVEALWAQLEKCLETDMGALNRFRFAESEVELWLLAAEALTLNYRLGTQEVSALKLLSTGTLEKVIQALVDWPTFEAALKAYAKGEGKKKQSSPAVSGSSTAGDGG